MIIGVFDATNHSISTGTEEQALQAETVGLRVNSLTNLSRQETGQPSVPLQHFLPLHQILNHRLLEVELVVGRVVLHQGLLMRPEQQNSIILLKQGTGKELFWQRQDLKHLMRLAVEEVDLDNQLILHQQLIQQQVEPQVVLHLYSLKVLQHLMIQVR